MLIVTEIKKKRYKIDKEEKVRLEANKSSWHNFFNVMNDLKSPIRRNSGESLGNFWAFVQHLQYQYEKSLNTK